LLIIAKKIIQNIIKNNKFKKNINYEKIILSYPIFLSAAIGVITQLGSCKKEEVNDVIKTNSIQQSLVSDSTINFIQNPHTLQELVDSNATNIDEKRINNILLYLSIGISEITKDKVILDWIIDHADSNDEVKLSQLINQFPNIEQQLINTIDPLNQIINPTINNLNNQLKNYGYSYEPVIYTQ